MGLFRSTQVVVAILILCAVGFGVFAYKVLALDFPIAPGQTTNFWDVETRVTFEGSGEAASIRVARLHETQYLALLNESYLAPPGFGERFPRVGDDEFVTFERNTVTTRASVYYRSIVVQLDSGPDRDVEAPVADNAYDEEARTILLEEEQTPFIFALDSLIGSAREGSASEEGFIDQLINDTVNNDDDRVMALSAGGPEGIDEPARRLAVVLNAAGVPARRVTGLILSDVQAAIGDAGAADPSEVRIWVDVWERNAWRPVDPATGDELPSRLLLPLVTGETPSITTTGVTNVSVDYSVARRSQDAATEAVRRSDAGAPIIAALSLLTLPQDTQAIFRVLMLIPIGAVLIAFLRQVIGLSTFGTFMPVLISLAFRETSLVTGVILFTGIVMIGIGLRAYFNGLQLLIVPRLAAVLSIVTIVIAMLALMGNAFRIPLGFSPALFPLVIITMTIERMSLTWDEFGAKEALTKGVGSLFAAVLAYLVMSNNYIEHIAFMFPELLLVAIAMMIAIGRYNGYKLTEYFRFRSLAEPEVK